jgi:hypothetical protein
MTVTLRLGPHSKFKPALVHQGTHPAQDRMTPSSDQARDEITDSDGNDQDGHYTADEQLGQP